MKKGISLVALVITIIVLIIITGVVVLNITNSNIFGNAQQAVDASNINTAREKVLLELQDIKIKAATQGKNVKEYMEGNTILEAELSGKGITYQTRTSDIEFRVPLSNKIYIVLTDFEGKYISASEETEEVIPTDPQAYMEVQPEDSSLWIVEGTTITEYTGTGEALNNVTVPNIVNGVRITQLGDTINSIGDFTGTLTIPNNVTVVSNAFNTGNYTNLVIGNNVTMTSPDEDYYIFNSNLTTVIIGDYCSLGASSSTEDYALIQINTNQSLISPSINIGDNFTINDGKIEFNGSYNNSIVDNSSFVIGDNFTMSGYAELAISEVKNINGNVLTIGNNFSMGENVNENLQDNCSILINNVLSNEPYNVAIGDDATIYMTREEGNLSYAIYTYNSHSEVVLSIGDNVKLNNLAICVGEDSTVSVGENGEIPEGSITHFNNNSDRVNHVYSVI